MPTRFKFCGLQTEADVRTAIDCGAWAVGFVLTESPRRIDPQTCERLQALAADRVHRIGLFTTEPVAVIREAQKRCGFDLLQVVGERPAGEWAELDDLPLLRAFRVKGAESLQALESVRGGTFLLDAYVPGVAGGSGERFDWSLARDACEYGRVILAGGLTPENVADAIRTARPWAVDVSSGIESTRGRKDHDRMRRFAEAVREADAGPA
jgi:phosphoribosylanthranilate isomerase